MLAFIRLYVALDSSTGTHAKIASLVDYFRAAPAADAAWAAFFLTGRKLKRLIKSADLRAAALACSGLPEWLFAASYDAVGDFAETIALLLPPPTGSTEESLATWVEEHLLILQGASPEEARARLIASWMRLDRDGRFVFGKLVTGEFRVGVARQLVLRALAEVSELPVSTIAHRLVGDWSPSAAFWDDLGREVGMHEHRPYPFFLAHALEADPASLGPIDDWQVEWKWDGIRAQLLRRKDGVSLWSRGEELISAQFPELIEAGQRLAAGTAIDGEVLAWDAVNGRPFPFAQLQQRLGRKEPSARIRRDIPVVLLAYDLLEVDETDIRWLPLRERRRRLEALLLDAALLPRVAPLRADDWRGLAQLRSQARERHAEGLMLKRLDSAYGVGRTRGSWWKWKVDPYTIDAVLVYAQPGQGRRASLFTDYTFALWHEGELVPFAKAYSGLTDAEIRKADGWIRSHTLEKFGPVRRVAPDLVFELAFESIQLSNRHKSGVAVRFPRIARWRLDKPASEADTLDGLKALVAVETLGPL